jgi:hypothetical protein
MLDRGHTNVAAGAWCSGGTRNEGKLSARLAFPGGIFVVSTERNS